MLQVGTLLARPAPPVRLERARGMIYRCRAVFASSDSPGGVGGRGANAFSPLGGAMSRTPISPPSFDRVSPALP